ncbi:MAG: amidohydrolase family protein [Coriobacteriales bacterium]|nr:amidohydrolase family protein [Coriobacteriales bacterium]
MILTARYVIPVATPHIENGAVLVRDDTIVEIGDYEHLRAAHPDEPVRDFGLAALLPGFIDLHTHLEYSSMRGLVDDLPYSRWKLQVMEREKHLSQTDWEDAAMLGALESLRSGITCVADITATGASARAAHASGLRATIYREAATMDRTKVDSVMLQADEDIRSWREIADPSRVQVGIAPHAAYSCHPELFKKIAEYAMDGTPVSIHLAGSKEEYEFVKYGSSMLAVDYRAAVPESPSVWLPTGVSPVRYVLQWGLFKVPNLLAVHVTQVDDSDIEVLASHDVSIAYCPRCNAKLGMGIAPLYKFIQSDLIVGIGTDSPASNNVIDMFDEMRIGLLLQRAILGEEHWLGARRFVKMATLDGARALGIDDRVGSLEPGKQADIVAIDLSHSHQVPTHYPYSTVVHTANQENVLLTMIGGEVAYEQGTWAALDQERIYARAEEMRVKLRS